MCIYCLRKWEGIDISPEGMTINSTDIKLPFRESIMDKISHSPKLKTKLPIVLQVSPLSTLPIVATLTVNTGIAYSVDLSRDENKF
jgi:hypothetical protein